MAERMVQIRFPIGYPNRIPDRHRRDNVHEGIESVGYERDRPARDPDRALYREQNQLAGDAGQRGAARPTLALGYVHSMRWTGSVIGSSSSGGIARSI